MCFKYTIDKPNIPWAKTRNSSQFWKNITWAFAAAKVFYRWVPRNGENVPFWHDTWLQEYSLKTRFWDLFVICQQQDASIAQVWDGVDLHLSFRRCVDELNLTRWFELVDLVRNFSPTSDLDRPVWTLEKAGLYSIKSLYKEINLGWCLLIGRILFRRSKCLPTSMCFCGLLSITKVLLEITWLNADMLKMFLVSFVMNLKISNTYFLIVLLLNICGLWW